MQALQGRQMNLIENERCAECGQPHPNLIRFEHGRPYCLGCHAETTLKLWYVAVETGDRGNDCPVCRA